LGEADRKKPNKIINCPILIATIAMDTVKAITTSPNKHVVLFTTLQK